MLLDPCIVLDNTVVDHYEMTPAGDLRMSVYLVGLTVGGPPGMPHGDGAVEILVAHHLLKLADPPRTLEYLCSFAIADGNPG